VRIDWTLLLVIDAALLVGATALILALFVRDLQRAKKGGHAPPDRDRSGD
jgi:hypothetical protein